jgi:ABC-2 type transport system ATP-binding protein
MITATGLTKRFGDFLAVNDITFSVEKGDIFAFLGPNGAGKTTTIRMLTTLLDPSAGTVMLNGANPAANRLAARRSFGIVFQDPSLDEELTASENMELHGVLYGVDKATRRMRSAELLELVDLADRADNLVRTFSGGMKRRLEIARGLIHHPAILFLDEPTLGLDPQTRNKMWGYIKELNTREGITVFFTTHYMEEADKAANKVAIIDRGTIVASGTPSGLKQQTGKATLEEAFLSLTGHRIREEEGSALDSFRQASKLWTGRR